MLAPNTSAPSNSREEILGHLAKAMQTPTLAGAIKKLANDILADYDSEGTKFSFTRGPVTGVVSAQVREPIFRQRFLPGDILASEAGVRVDEHDGWGMCFGNDRSGAVALAICDAEIARESRRAAAVRALAARCAAHLEQQRAEDFERLRPSIVEFEEIS